MRILTDLIARLSSPLQRGPGTSRGDTGERVARVLARVAKIEAEQRVALAALKAEADAVRDRGAA